METIYRVKDGKEFTNKEKAEKYEQNILKMKKIFDKLVDSNFFPNYKIPSFYHNYEVTHLGNPQKSNWKWKYNGYVLVRGRMGNGDTIVSFKIRGNKLLIFRWDTDDDMREGKRYLGSIIINEKLEKIKKLKERITS